MLAVFAANPQEAVFEPATRQEILKISLYIEWQCPTMGLKIFLELRVISLNNLIQKGLFWLMSLIVRCSTLSGIPCQEHVAILCELYVQPVYFESL
jgi:hypothetical protein